MFVSKWTDIREERVSGSNRITEQCSSSLKINGDGLTSKSSTKSKKSWAAPGFQLVDSIELLINIEKGH